MLSLATSCRSVIERPSTNKVVTYRWHPATILPNSALLLQTTYPLSNSQTELRRQQQHPRYSMTMNQKKRPNGQKYDEITNISNKIWKHTSFHNQIQSQFFKYLFADADFCCGMDTPAKARTDCSWKPGRQRTFGVITF